MPFEVKSATMGEYESSPRGVLTHAEGFVVLESSSQKEVATFQEESDAIKKAEKLNEREKRGLPVPGKE